MFVGDAEAWAVPLHTRVPSVSTRCATGEKVERKRERERERERGEEKGDDRGKRGGHTSLQYCRRDIFLDNVPNIDSPSLQTVWFVW